MKRELMYDLQDADSFFLLIVPCVFYRQVKKVMRDSEEYQVNPYPLGRVCEPLSYCEK